MTKVEVYLEQVIDKKSNYLQRSVPLLQENTRNRPQRLKH